MSINPRNPSQFRLAKTNFRYKEGPADRIVSSANAFVENHRIAVIYNKDRFKVVVDNRFGSTFKVDNPDENENFLFSVFGKFYTVVRDSGNTYKMYGMVKYGSKECINEGDVIRLHARPGHVGGRAQGKLCNCPQFTPNWMENIVTNHNYKIGRRHF